MTPMAPYQVLTEALTRCIQDMGLAELPSLSPPLDPSHGDLSTPIAFSLAKLLKQAPQAIAQQLCQSLSEHPLIEKAQALNGHVNITLKPHIWQDVFKIIFSQKNRYGHHSFAQGHMINIEYVSANPTGPLHAAHSRGAIVGDIIANLLEAIGYTVTREFFINDAGAQVGKLAETVLMHCQALADGKEAMIPEGLYPGEYLKETAKVFMKRYPQWQQLSQDQQLALMGQFAVHDMMIDIQKTLEDLDIHHQVFTSEKAIHAAGLVNQVVQHLESKGFVYWGTLPPPKTSHHISPATKEEESFFQDMPPYILPEGEIFNQSYSKPLMLFRSTAFQDSQDRPLKRADGTWTYLAGDIAYHWDKSRRTQGTLINIWGPDHDSHVQRMKAAVKATCDQNLEVIICQWVRFFHQGKLLKMSKRAGTFVSVQDILSLIDKEALRFMMVTKKNDTHLDLDIEAMKEQTKDNPVFYVNYAYARCCSILRAAQDMFKAEELEPYALSKAPFLSFDEHLVLIKLLADWPRQVEQAALAREPHRITTYLYKLAQAFHGLWQQGNTHPALRFLKPQDPQSSYSNVAFVQAIAFVLESGFAILGITPRKEMR